MVQNSTMQKMKYRGNPGKRNVDIVGYEIGISIKLERRGGLLFTK